VCIHIQGDLRKYKLFSSRSGPLLPSVQRPRSVFASFRRQERTVSARRTFKTQRRTPLLRLQYVVSVKRYRKTSIFDNYGSKRFPSPPWLVDVVVHRYAAENGPPFRSFGKKSCRNARTTDSPWPANVTNRAVFENLGVEYGRWETRIIRNSAYIIILFRFAAVVVSSKGIANEAEWRGNAGGLRRNSVPKPRRRRAVIMNTGRRRFFVFDARSRRKNRRLNRATKTTYK